MTKYIHYNWKQIREKSWQKKIYIFAVAFLMPELFAMKDPNVICWMSDIWYFLYYDRDIKHSCEYFCISGFVAPTSLSAMAGLGGCWGKSRDCSGGHQNNPSKSFLPSFLHDSRNKQTSKLNKKQTNKQLPARREVDNLATRWCHFQCNSWKLQIWRQPSKKK